MPDPAVAVVIPTAGRPAYLDVTLASLRDQLGAPEHELLVVDDGPSDQTRAMAARHGVRVVAADPPGGLNAARNTGVRNTRAPLIAFVDDDVRVPQRWIAELVDGAARHPSAEGFGGPIRASLEGPAPHGCGREQPPITTLDLGSVDVETELVWGANMAFRRSAFARVGEFDEQLPLYGEEELWVSGLRRAGGTIVYLAAAGLDHRRAGNDARLRALLRSELRRGHTARALDQRKGGAPPLRAELRDLGGAVWHTLRRRCALGLTMVAHAVGRLLEALRSR